MSDGWLLAIGQNELDSNKLLTHNANQTQHARYLKVKKFCIATPQMKIVLFNALNTQITTAKVNTKHDTCIVL